MKNHFRLVYLVLFLLIPCANFAQAPSFGIAETFVVFTKTGALTSEAGVSLVGNLGRETAGAISGFNASNVKGKIYFNVQNVTTKCSSDLYTAYTQINAMVATQPHSNIFGGETLKPGVISIGTSAASASDTLRFDAQNDTDNVFIIHMKAAFVTAAGFTCVLVNGARSRNIVWVVEGALTFGAGNHLLGTFLALDGAVVVGAGCTLEGRLTSTTGAMTMNDLHAVISPGLFKNYWDGTVYSSTDWFNTMNWTIDVPDINSKVYLTKNTAANPYYPVISSSTASVTAAIASLQIDSSALLTITNNKAGGYISKLSVAGAIVDTFGIDASAGTLEFNGPSTSPQIMPGRLFVKNNIQNLILSNSVDITGLQNITGNLSFTGSNRTLNTNGYLALKSSASGTAQLADITNGGANSGNTIVGNVSIERYITPKRAWRLLSVPIGNSLATSPTINASWQEGATTDTTNQQVINPNPGFGTFVTGGNPDNGYDIGVNHHPSLKVYDSVTNTLIGIPIGTGTGIGNGTYIPITTYPAYFIFVRGDRGVLLLQGVNTVPTNTILRIAGSVNTNDQILNVSSSNFTLISNPYPASINFGTITKRNVADNFYVWNPQIGTIGGYVTITDGVNGSYVAVPNSTKSSQYIASGEAFFVQSLDGTTGGEITIKEIDKNNHGSDSVFRPMTASGSMRVNLSAFNADSSKTLVDGIYTFYADNNSNTSNNRAIIKMFNINENICLGRDKKLLAIEKRQTIISNDTSFIKLYLLKKQRYQLAISAENLNDSGITALLKDKYDSTINNRILDLSGAINNINFIVNNDTGSYAVDRFSIVYNRPEIAAPVKFVSIGVSLQQKDVLLSFKIANELQVKEYVIETATSINGLSANAAVLAKFNDGRQAAYSWLDKNPTDGKHYYRVKFADNSGKENYSNIVEILVENGRAASAINVYPNLIKDNNIFYKLNNIIAGTYKISLVNMEGQLLNSFLIHHDGANNIAHVININPIITKGKYILQLSGNSTKLSASIIKE